MLLPISLYCEETSSCDGDDVRPDSSATIDGLDSETKQPDVGSKNNNTAGINNFILSFANIISFPAITKPVKKPPVYTGTLYRNFRRI